MVSIHFLLIVCIVNSYLLCYCIAWWKIEKYKKNESLLELGCSSGFKYTFAWKLTDNYRHQFSSVTQSCLTLDCNTPGFPVHQLLEPAQTHIHRVGDAIQPSHLRSSPSPPAFNLSQHQGLFQWVSSLHQVAKVLEFQLQHQSFQWIFRTDFL